MKVKVTNEFKKIVTVAQMPVVKQMIKDLKEDDSLKEYATMAARVASNSNETFEILKVEAEMAKNNHVYNYYNDDSEDLDIWIAVYAFNPYYGFYDFGIYLSDIWSITGYNNDDIRSRMYIQAYKR